MRALLMSLLVLLSCASASGAGLLPQAPDDAEPTFTFSQFAPGAPIHFVAYGDTRFTNPSTTKGVDPRIRKWLAQKIGKEDPQVLLITGDTPFTGSSVADWQEFQDETASWRSGSLLVLPTTGNHEIYGGAPQGIANYLKSFPEIQNHRYYSALLGNVEVISLDCTSASGRTTAQGDWFATQLSHVPPQVEFLFILYHLPWMADKQSQVFVNLPSSDAVGLRGILEAHLAKLHARVVVFNGHIHNYERFVRNGVEYVVTGGGGAEPYPLLYRGRADLYRDQGFPVYNFVTIEVGKRALHAVMWKVKDPQAAELSVEAKDEFTLSAPGRKTGARSRAHPRKH
jgi:acid phosphatase type 7